MNRVILMGRLTRDPEIRYSQNDQSMAIARYTLAVDRRGRRDGNDGQQTADFISCVAFRQQAEFAEKYLRKGMKIAVTGRIQTGSYTNRDGQKVYTTDVIVDDHEFCESKNANSSGSGSYSGGFAPASDNRPSPDNAVSDGFMNIPDGIDEELPWN
ncbi:MAG: single-stranded DNA-binding protein [Clostridiales bacterium]|nr:single-stranded DNA-binding protein [Clostridiales bacterium]MCD8364597.1 single-stranded DNA-binding protein [Clostridiales bacterium]